MRRLMSFCSDQWKAFSHVFKKGNLWAGKDLARPNEEVNNILRVRNRYFMRKITCSSKQDENQEAAIKIRCQ
jgi:IS1 family transposase